MIPQDIRVHLLTIAQAAGFILANRLTPDSVRQIFTDLTAELRKTLSSDDKRDVEAAEAKAVLRATAYRRDD